MIEEQIRHSLRTTPVVIGQLDPNGTCNARCWFCPVKYEGNPEEFETHLSLEHLDLILRRVRESTVFDQRSNFIYTAHYNEVLLYRHFEALPEVFRRNRFTTMVLSNGTPLSPAKTDFIMNNTDVFLDVCLNIPGFDEADWALKSGFDRKIHKILMRNLDYLHERATIPVLVLVNTLTQEWSRDLRENGILTPGWKLREIVDSFKQRFPRFKVEPVTGLVDRAGALDRRGVLKNQAAIMLPGQKVVGCKHDLHQGSRIYGWLHINSKGDLFLCCDDYHMRYRFGNLIEKPLDEIWLSDEHVKVIKQAFTEICRGCVHHAVE